MGTQIDEPMAEGDFLHVLGLRRLLAAAPCLHPRAGAPESIRQPCAERIPSLHRALGERRRCPGGTVQTAELEKAHRGSRLGVSFTRQVIHGQVNHVPACGTSAGRPRASRRLHGPQLDGVYDANDIVAGIRDRTGARSVQQLGRNDHAAAR